VSENVEKQEQTRLAIMTHAIGLFAHYGYGKTNIGDIAKACSMSPGNLYRYFKNKQGIGEAVVQDYMNAEVTSVEATLTDPKLDWEVRLRHVILFAVENLIRQYRQTPKMVELSDMICYGNSGILARHVEWQRITVRAQLDEGVRLGVLKIDTDETDRVSGIILDSVQAFLIPKTLEQTDLDSVPERVDAILDLILSGLKNSA